MGGVSERRFPRARGDAPTAHFQGEAAVVATFDAFRKKRNIVGYERIGLVSDADADAMRALAIQLRDQVVAWLRTHHRHLLPPTS